MQTCLIFAALIFISRHYEVFCYEEDSVEKFEESSLTSEVVRLLNGTYFNLNEKVCQLQRRVDAIGGTTNSTSQCPCNNTEILEFKRSVSNELNDFSKTLSGFENEIRTLKNEQAELRELVQGGGDSDASSTTTTAATTTAEPECDDGWIMSPGGKCYYVSTTSQKTEWSRAINRCSDMGAKLVEFQTNEEAQFVMRNLPSRVSTSDIVYTGRKRNDAYVWVFLSNDEPVDTAVRTWGSGEPDGGTQTCGCTRKSDDFEMLDCLCTGYNLFYICENLPRPVSTTTATTSTTSAATTTGAPKDCDNGWISSPEKCYYVSTTSEKTDWGVAVSRCTKKGANLVEIKSDKEAQFIMENLPSRVGTSDIIYTGRKRNDEEVWVYLSNDEVVKTTERSWASGEPDGGTQRCGCTRRSENFLMLDCFCTGYNLFYICEIVR
ncbi:low affinity immunoglobulin epsilon Fc receptor-like [Pecten maximus]|uniref:low affinity immunoglobulin epsilon Fc receptor-like n=1 Tax=Pecten maximus TaxID=6579 RepID=UPI001458360B|nr:low affinity immunoglobulin epsilon Fc receptor-like [Pecten maximus]